MKKLIVVCILFTLTACAHTPTGTEKIDTYLDDMCYVAADYGYEAALEGKSELEMHRDLREALRSF